MNDCPDRAVLISFLELDDQAQARSGLETHVNACAACQATLRLILLSRADAPPGPARDEPPPTPAGYELLEPLGAGGMGAVWKAWQLRPRRLVALKFARPDARLRQRFLAEPDKLALLHHPNIVQVFEARPDDPGGPFFAMEFVAGGSLADRLDGSPWPPAAAAALVETLARAAAHAHAAGVVHRDLKPANVLLQAASDAPLPLLEGVIPKIADFGLARVQGDAGQTETGQVLGTPAYMSPEQATGLPEAVGPPADLWALGVLLYELLTGRPPFRAPTPLETLARVRDQDAVPVRELQPQVPRDLELVCGQCLAKSPRQRYASAAALADDLRRFQSGEPVLARPPSLATQLRRLARAYPLLVRVGAATLLLFALAAGAAIAGLWIQAAQARADLAEGKVQRLTAEELATRARLHLQKGEWPEARAAFDAALAAGHPQPAALRLEKLKVWFVLNDAAAAQRELAALAADPDAGDHEAAALLWQGDHLLGHDNAAARRLIEQALARGLPRPVDRHYAEALTATRADAAAARFREVVALEPWHPRANQMLILTLFLLGEKAEARLRLDLTRTYFPTDPGLRLIEIALLASDGRRAEAEALLANSAEILGPARRDYARDQLPLLLKFAAVEEWFFDPKATIPMPAGASAVPGLPPADLLSFPVPPFLATASERLRQVPLQPQHLEACLTEMCDVLPEGTHHFVLGLLHFRARRFAQAEDALLKAARLPAQFPVRRAALHTALSSQAALLAFGQADPALKARTVQALAEMRVTGPPRPEWCFNLAHAARRSEQYDHAREIATHWEKSGAPPTDVRFLRAQIDFSNGLYARAGQGAAEVLQAVPDHAYARVLLKLAEESLKK